MKREDISDALGLVDESMISHALMVLFAVLRQKDVFRRKEFAFQHCADHRFEQPAFSDKCCLDFVHDFHLAFVIRNGLEIVRAHGPYLFPGVPHYPCAPFVSLQFLHILFPFIPYHKPEIRIWQCLFCIILRFV